MCNAHLQSCLQVTRSPAPPWPPPHVLYFRLEPAAAGAASPGSSSTCSSSLLEEPLSCEAVVLQFEAAMAPPPPAIRRRPDASRQLLLQEGEALGGGCAVGAADASPGGDSGGMGAWPLQGWCFKCRVHMLARLSFPAGQTKPARGPPACAGDPHSIINVALRKMQQQERGASEWATACPGEAAPPPHRPHATHQHWTPEGGEASNPMAGGRSALHGCWEGAANPKPASSAGSSPRARKEQPLLASQQVVGSSDVGSSVVAALEASSSHGPLFQEVQLLLRGGAEQPLQGRLPPHALQQLYEESMRQ